MPLSAKSCHFFNGTADSIGARLRSNPSGPPFGHQRSSCVWLVQHEPVKMKLNMSIQAARAGMRTTVEPGKCEMETAPCHSVGFVRREFIQVGFSGLLGFGLPNLISARACAGVCAGERCPPACGPSGKVGHPRVLDRRVEPPRFVRHEAGCSRRHTWRVQANCDLRPGHSVLRALAPARGPSRSAGDRAVALALVPQSLERDS